MSNTHLHLIIVHLPVVGVLFTCMLLVCAHVLKEEILYKISYAFLIICAILACISYVTGPLAYEEQAGIDKKYVENHAIIAKCAFIVLILLGVICFNALTQYFQEEKPAKLHRYIIFFLTIVVLYLLLWTAHLGGSIHHPQVRETNLFFWPDLK